MCYLIALTLVHICKNYGKIKNNNLKCSSQGHMIIKPVY